MTNPQEEQAVKELAKEHNGHGTTAKDIKVAHWIQRIAIVLFLIMACFFGVVYYWTLTPDHVLVVNNEPMPVHPNPTKPETAIFVHFDYCKTYAATGTVRVSFISNKTEIFQPTYQDTQPKQCLKVDAPLLLPPQVVPDVYRVHYHVVYDANPLRKITDDFYSKPFTIE